jgi:hypothetical protein
MRNAPAKLQSVQIRVRPEAAQLNSDALSASARKAGRATEPAERSDGKSLGAATQYRTCRQGSVAAEGQSYDPLRKREERIRSAAEDDINGAHDVDAAARPSAAGGLSSTLIRQRHYAAWMSITNVSLQPNSTDPPVQHTKVSDQQAPI